MLGSSIRRNSLLLTAFALATAGMLALTYENTRERIAQQERQAAAKALLEIIPPARHDNDLLSDTLAIPSTYWSLLGLEGPAVIHIARKQQRAVAAIIPAIASEGYSGPLKLLVGVNRDGTIAGVRVLSHNETPGLGDKVESEKSPWIFDFTGTSLGRPPPERWGVKKDGGDFDQFTGATITPRAVIKQVRNTLAVFLAWQPLSPLAPASNSPEQTATEPSATPTTTEHH